MKNLLIAVTALATLASAPAFAQSVTVNAQQGTLSYGGSAAATCSVLANAPSIISLGALTTGAGTFNSSAVDALSGTYGSTIICNGAGTVLAMTANQIVGSVGVPNGAPVAFTNQINYKSTLGIVSGGYAQNPVSSTVLLSDATGGSGATRTIGLLMSDISFQLSDAQLPAGASILVASNNYSGSTTITLTPGV